MPAQDTEQCRLQQGAESLGISLDDQQARLLLEYLDEMVRWNRAYNLTAVRDRDQMVPRHLLDSLAISPWIAGTELLDVGAGAGLPGIPLAIARPQLKVTLLDSNGKKVRFMRHVARTLRIENFDAVHERVESFEPGRTFAQLVARAFAPTQKLLQLVARLVAPGGQVVAMKGPSELEPSSPHDAFEFERRVDLDVPGQPKGRHLMIYRRKQVWEES